ncbi:MAG: DegT/DnrJ/EryC1/StrS family aminotransferase, partial [Microthrixaceae bacterium]|nr:DegT/DnrJ/EryC1/StrS family aminotransferase [Microthrixaceae bacterium]
LNDPADVERAEILTDKGTDRRRFLRGERSAYTWRLTGSAFGLGEIQAAYLVGQLRRRDVVLARRAELWGRYRAQLAPVADHYGLTLPHDGGEGSARHQFYVVVDGDGRRDRVLRTLGDGGIGAAFHYQPLHRSPAGLAASDRPADCPVTDRVSARLLRLPFHNALTDTDVDQVVGQLIAALGSA